MSDEETYTGRRGRKKMTDAQKQSPAATKVQGLKADAFLPSPSDNLDGEAKQEWQRVGQYLLLTGRVSKLDYQALSVYATSYAIYADAMRQLLIGRQPLWGEINGKPKPAKVVDLTLKYGGVIVRLSRKFGMTARTRHLDHHDSGRPATPQQIHDLRGTVPYRSRKHKPSLPRWDKDSVACPGWFTKSAEAEWQRIVDQLDVVQLWTPLDVGPIAVLSASYALAAKCAADFRDQPLVLPIRDGEGGMEHPLSIIYERQFALCETIWTDYGMTPYDRQQFHHIEGEQQGKPKLQVFPGELA